jgi:putative zinc finger/helix-turn-helix YgiT family protein
MRCTECKTGSIVLERVTRAFSEQLPDVVVDGVERGKCANCGHTFTSFPRWSDLSNRVVGALIAKPTRLTAGEIRFLRLTIGLKAQGLADTLGVTPSQVSRWENGAVPISGLADRLFRMVVATRMTLELPDLTSIRAGGSAPLSLRVELGRRGWKTMERNAKAA